MKPFKKARDLKSTENLVAKVWAKSKTAVPVWLFLDLLAERKGRNRFSVKRRTLGRFLGVERLPTITHALATLEALGIIQRIVKRCRRPDGTLFHRLVVRLCHRITLSVPWRGHQHTLSVRNRQVRSTGYAPGTPPAHGKRSHSPGTPAHAERNPSSIEDGGTCGVDAPHRTHAAGAAAAGLRRSADAPRRARMPAAGLDLPKDWPPMKPGLLEFMRQVCRQVGCTPADFIVEGDSFLALLNEADEQAPFVTISQLTERPAEAEFVTPCGAEKTHDAPWTGSAEQVAAIHRMLEAKEKSVPWGWTRLKSIVRVMAGHVAQDVGCTLSDFHHEPRDPGYLTLGNVDEHYEGAWLEIDEQGTRWLHRVRDGHQTESEPEPWTGSEEQRACVQRSIQEDARAKTPMVTDRHHADKPGHTG